MDAQILHFPFTSSSSTIVKAARRLFIARLSSEMMVLTNELLLYLIHISYLAFQVFVPYVKYIAKHCFQALQLRKKSSPNSFVFFSTINDN